MRTSYTAYSMLLMHTDNCSLREGAVRSRTHPATRGSVRTDQADLRWTLRHEKCTETNTSANVFILQWGRREGGREGGRHDCIIMPKSAVFGVCANLNASPAGVAEVKQPAPAENMISYEREIDADQRDGPRLRGIRAS